MGAMQILWLRQSRVFWRGDETVLKTLALCLLLAALSPARTSERSRDYEIQYRISFKMQQSDGSPVEFVYEWHTEPRRGRMVWPAEIIR
jgi:hypothetical protein